MKKTILFSILALCAPFSGAMPADVLVQKDVCAGRPDGERQAIARRLYGRIQFVKHSTEADYRVYATSRVTEADLRVQIVPGGATCPGMWQIVNSGGDFRVYITNLATEADIIIYFANSAPGPMR